MNHQWVHLRLSHRSHQGIHRQFNKQTHTLVVAALVTGPVTFISILQKNRQIKSATKYLANFYYLLINKSCLFSLFLCFRGLRLLKYSENLMFKPKWQYAQWLNWFKILFTYRNFMNTYPIIKNLWLDILIYFISLHFICNFTLLSPPLHFYCFITLLHHHYTFVIHIVSKINIHKSFIQTFSRQFWMQSRNSNGCFIGATDPTNSIHF